MARSFDRAIVLGANIEGLAAAVVLAQSGKQVHVVDAANEAGGVSTDIEIHPGHTVPGLLHETALIRSSLLRPLGLEQHGLEWRDRSSSITVVTADGGRLHIHPDSLDTNDTEELSSSDRQRFTEWRARMDRLAPLIRDVIDDAPPEARDPSTGELFRLAKKGLKLRTLGDADMMELLRIVTMPAWDWTGEWFESAALRAGLTAPVLTGSVLGPRAAGTTALILMREAARGAEPKGGLAAVTRALLARCAELGVEFELGNAAARIMVEHSSSLSSSACSGVELTDGRALEAELILSALDPRATLLELVEPGWMSHGVEAEVRAWRTRGSSAVLLLALSSPPGSGAGIERLITASDPVVLERAADALKYGELPADPWLDVRLWSASDPETAPDSNSATLSIHVHGVPYALAAGWDDGARTVLRNKILDALERVLPASRNSIVAEQLLTPVDIEARFAAPGGHLYHGEQVLDQLWVQRPSVALSRYATPIAGLYLGGSGNHPGGPFVGGAGVLAAKMALRG